MAQPTHAELLAERKELKSRIAELENSELSANSELRKEIETLKAAQAPVSEFASASTYEGRTASEWKHAFDQAQLEILRLNDKQPSEGQALADMLAGSGRLATAKINAEVTGRVA